MSSPIRIHLKHQETNEAFSPGSFFQLSLYIAFFQFAHGQNFEKRKNQKILRFF